MNTTQMTFRLDYKTLAKLDEMCASANMTRGQLLKSFIDTQYDVVMGNPKFKQMIDKLKDLQEFLQNQ